jgi:heme oxygenase
MHEDDLWIDVPLDMTQSQTAPQAEQDAAASESSNSAPTSPSVVLSVLKTLRPHGLARSDRLKRDIATLLGLQLSEVDSYLDTIQSDATESFINHINLAVRQKPHLLIAYAFTLYLAIFSGGRWIRSLLSAPGPSFWAQDGDIGSASSSMQYDSSVHEKLRSFTTAQQESFENLGLAFWFFPSLTDGMDIKTEFKKRLESAEQLLTAEMKNEIVDEAREIFIRCEGLVGELDERVGRKGELVNGGVRIGAIVIPQPTANAGPEKGWLERTWKSGVAMTNRYDVPSYAAWALVISSVSWYAMYHAGTWSA